MENKGNKGNCKFGKLEKSTGLIFCKRLQRIIYSDSFGNFLKCEKCEEKKDEYKG